MVSSWMLTLALSPHVVVAERVRRHVQNLEGRHCPAGLKKLHVEQNGTKMKKCVYEGPPVPPLTWGPTHAFPDFWDSAGSNSQLYFEAEKQYLNVQAFFLDEMAAAAGSKKILDHVAADVQRSLREKLTGTEGGNAIGKVDAKSGADEAFQHDDDHHKHTILENITHGLHEAHELVENFQPVEKVAMHPVEHAVLHEVGHGLHALEHVAEAAHFAGAEILEGGLEFLVVGVEAAVSPWALIPMALYTAYNMEQHYKKVGKHAELFASSLVLKADCMVEKICLDPKKASFMFKAGRAADMWTHRGGHTFFRQEVRDVCPLYTRKLLMMQVQRTNFALQRLFDAIRSLGMCLHQPEGWSWDALKSRWVSKQNCAEAVYEPLRMFNGGSGLLSNALALAATYGTMTDNLLSEPGLYQDWFMKELGITKSPPGTYQSTIDNLKQTNEMDLKSRTLSCVSMLATHRAFERVFFRLAQALPVFMQTYAREFRLWDIREGPFVRPCRRIISSVKDVPDGMLYCKKPYPFNETSACDRGDVTPSLWPESSPVDCAETKKYYSMGQHAGLKDAYSISTALGLAQRLNMHGTGETKEFSASLCQARCKRQAGCAYFTWFPKGQCYLADENATLKHIHDFEGPQIWHSKTIAGPRTCP